ncbi:tyrosine-type recombinase/integrase [Halorussus limi]|uniref:Tyrosine-type recombinase/integrase n=2 Tax=Halorussus TaxID=1070314 RepID=A0A8U0IMQ2_9EURY|nr:MULTISPECIES: tyrosine-type recombinase/integrase [Halorussus]UPV75630.1 tyrosine-type recombinase/integrase [Halorussus limi]UPW01702.1 tyrosine-type recombinase/integrase [Halorussus gelatinilyticus]
MPGMTYNPLGLSGDRDKTGTFRPAPKSQYIRFREAAKDGDVLDELIGLTLTSTGIRAAAMAHMTPSWWCNGPNERPHVEIPYGEVCTLGSGNGSGGDTNPTGVPCFHCRNRAEKYWAPAGADFTPKSEAGVRPIPVRDDDTIHILNSYFDLYENVAAQGTITNRVKSIAERAGFERRVVAHDLRDTYGTLLAKKDFGPHKIKALMGHANLEEAIKYIKFAGEDVQDEYDDKW